MGLFPFYMSEGSFSSFSEEYYYCRHLQDRYMIITSTFSWHASLLQAWPDADAGKAVLYQKVLNTTTLTDNFLEVWTQKLCTQSPEEEIVAFVVTCEMSCAQLYFFTLSTTTFFNDGSLKARRQQGSHIYSCPACFTPVVIVKVFCLITLCTHTRDGLWVGITHLKEQQLL